MTITTGTHAFYEGWAAHGEENPRSLLSQRFETSFAPGARVLDVGCGKGRDVVALLDMGFDAYGVEPHDAMRAQALARDARTPGRIAAASLPDLGQPFGGRFDAVVCSAVLMHLSRELLPASLRAMTDVLRPRSRVLLAVPEMLPTLLVDGVDPDGRQFDNHAPRHVAQLMAERGFKQVSCDELVSSADTRWRVMLFAREP